MITVPDGFEQRDPDGCHPQPGTTQILGGGRTRGCGHAPKPTGINTNDSR
jgi:hypothetical protein